MKKIIFLTYIIFSCSNFSKAAGEPLKGSFSGVIKDMITGLPIPGATVYIADMKVGSSTNTRGEFSIINISEGFHLVEVSHIGYTTIAENILIQGDIKKDFLA
jgi:iron complex outermembrane receptor protein